ncbi:MAG: hypothetical protein EHM93_14530 [Bacteroidales bacterium]|nr:MAG: hypothetical protein EHM93_14530 [Bacteroidales bacterium]
MKARLIRYSIAILALSLASGQISGQSKNSFEKIFEKETNGAAVEESTKFKNISTLSYYPDTLPTWFFTPPPSTLNSIYAVGVSDPDMEPAQAKEMAIHRAKAMVVLCRNAKLQYFRDVYTSEKESGRYTDYRQRFDTYFKISSLSKIDEASFALVDSHLNRYNESLVLIKYSPNPSPPEENNLLSVVGTVLYVEAQVEDAFEVQAEYELLSAFRQPEKDIKSAHLLYREKGNKFLSNSEYLDSLNEFPIFIYKYASPDWDKNTQPLVSYNGLWSKFTREMLRTLTLTTEQTKIRIKNLGEKYNPATSNLTREVVSYLAQVKLNGIVFERDSMKLDLTVNEIIPEIK